MIIQPSYNRSEDKLSTCTQCNFSLSSFSSFIICVQTEQHWCCTTVTAWISLSLSLSLSLSVRCCLELWLQKSVPMEGWQLHIGISATSWPLPQESHSPCKALILTCTLCVCFHVCVSVSEQQVHSPVASLRKPIFTWAHSVLLAQCTPALSKYFTTTSLCPSFQATCGFEGQYWYWFVLFNCLLPTNCTNTA